MNKREFLKAAGATARASREAAAAGRPSCL